MDEGTVWLVGMMGAGKSAVGRALARLLDREWVDVDARVVEMAGLPIAEIFAREGEAHFRALERRAIEEIAGKPVVASLGGGAPAQEGIPERLAQSGHVVYLRARVETLARRVARGGGRPLLQGLDEAGRRDRLEALLGERSVAYERADLVIDTDDLDVARASQCIAAELEART